MKDEYWAEAIFIAFIIYMLVPAKEQEVVSVYIGTCSDREHSVDDCPVETYTTELTYKVLIPQQKVILKGSMWMDNKSCSVFDAENWYCEEGGYSKRMTDGDFYEGTSDYVTKGIFAPKKGERPSFPLAKQIGSTRYWYHKIKNMLF